MQDKIQAETREQGSILAGFRNEATESSQLFRDIMTAMSRPGQIQDLSVTLPAPAGLTAATTAILLTLCDFETKLLLSGSAKTAQAQSHLSFHTDTQLVTQSDQADYAVADMAETLDFCRDLPIGTAISPEKSATLILQVEKLTQDNPQLCLTGPGIETEARLGFGQSNFPQMLATYLQETRRYFPAGLDLLFTDQQQIAALPRTTQFKMIDPTGQG